MPITKEINEVLGGNKKVEQVVHDLMTRTSIEENSEENFFIQM
jgi:glycerol-3-phosphate dehydrogenase